MTFLALLTKELRLRMRRERTVWVVIVYILLMGLLGGFYISRYANTTNGYANSVTLSQTGSVLYILLSFVQLFLILFITPAFTSTSINGEKERQTFDLLLCSRLSSFALVSGKLVAGLANALL
ncbi:MAG: ABC transporter permease subunit, partial [Ktedonobacteraceae bacterium]|nr:ABC transporter permease subunit [Ktedonobacteraceae bacterium]